MRTSFLSRLESLGQVLRRRFLMQATELGQPSRELLVQTGPVPGEGRQTMETKIKHATGLNRLEDFINQARHGQEVRVEPTLRTEKIISQGEHCAEDEPRVEGFLFVADFLCTLGGDSYRVSKVYALSYLTQETTHLLVDLQVANARLKMDYERLKKAGITCPEVYFRESSCR